MPQISLAAQSRNDFGKGAARRLRREGRVPAVVYGAGSELLTQALRTSNLVIELTGVGNGVKVAPREVQRDAVRQIIEHVDLLVLTDAEASARLA